MKSFLDQESEQNQVISEINVTPLVDVMLLLMIIFLVTAPLLVNEINVALPKARGSLQSKSESKTISIKESGEINFDGKKIAINKLEKLLKSQNDKDVVVKIVADKNCRYQDIAAILSLLGRSKITNISFSTQN